MKLSRIEKNKLIDVLCYYFDNAHFLDLSENQEQIDNYENSREMLAKLEGREFKRLAWTNSGKPANEVYDYA